jgi:hypothetical protein
MSVKVSELKLSQTIFLRVLKFFSEQRGDILSSYCDGELSWTIDLLQETHVSTIHNILTINLDSIFFGAHG